MIICKSYVYITPQDLHKAYYRAYWNHWCDNQSTCHLAFCQLPNSSQIASTFTPSPCCYWFCSFFRCIYNTCMRRNLLGVAGIHEHSSLLLSALGCWFSCQALCIAGQPSTPDLTTTLRLTFQNLVTKLLIGFMPLQSCLNPLQSSSTCVCRCCWE